ncbi:hypothetical protein [Mycolicibacterium sp. XJ879]
MIRNAPLKTCRSFVALAISTSAIALLPGVVAPARADDAQSVRTQSGKVRCLVYANDTAHGGGPLVVCEYNPGFPQAPAPSTGIHWNLAVVRGNGQLNWDVGNIGGSTQAMSKDIVLHYGQTYHVNGWTITPAFEGTRFTNDQTGHGMFVSIENVYSF